MEAAAERLRAAGLRVTVPDLYGGQVAETLDEGFALSERIGWAAIMRRASDAVRDLPADAVLAGLSMGAGVAGELLADRPRAAGLLLLHGTGGEPRGGLAVQAHIGDHDEMFPPASVGDWRHRMEAGGAVVELFTYPGAGHFFTDPDVPEHHAEAAGLAWRRSIEFLRERWTTNRHGNAAGAG